MPWLREHIFLFDGVGALVSLVLAAFVLPALQPWIGPPRAALFALALPAMLLGTLSLSCALLQAEPRRWLPPVIAGNVGYCLFVVGWLGWHSLAMTGWGWAYFAGEAMVMAMVIGVEARLWTTAFVR